jgi:hypothetical protein
MAKWDYLEKDLKKLADIDNQIAKLNERKKEIKSQGALFGKIKHHEERYFNAAPHVIESLVLIGESFEEWYERFAKYMTGITKKKTDQDWENHKEWTKEYYLTNGITENMNYIKWMVEVDDPRIVNTEYYRKDVEKTKNV